MIFFRGKLFKSNSVNLKWNILSLSFNFSFKNITGKALQNWSFRLPGSPINMGRSVSFSLLGTYLSSFPSHVPFTKVISSNAMSLWYVLPTLAENITYKELQRSNIYSEGILARFQLIAFQHKTLFPLSYALVSPFCLKYICIVLTV